MCGGQKANIMQNSDMIKLLKDEGIYPGKIMEKETSSYLNV